VDCPAEEIANRIELHLRLDTVGTEYALSTEDQRIIIDCLRFASRAQSVPCNRCGRIVVTNTETQMTEETPTATWLLTMAQDIADSDGVATLVKRNDPSVKKIKPEYYGDMIISTPLKASDLIWALRRAAATLIPS